MGKQLYFVDLKYQFRGENEANYELSFWLQRCISSGLPNHTCLWTLYPYYSESDHVFLVKGVIMVYPVITSRFICCVTKGEGLHCIVFLGTRNNLVESIITVISVIDYQINIFQTPTVRRNSFIIVKTNMIRHTCSHLPCDWMLCSMNFTLIFMTQGIYMEYVSEAYISLSNRNIRTCIMHIGAINMMTSSNGNIFRVNGPLRGEFAGNRRIPLPKASVAELWCFFDLRIE